MQNILAFKYLNEAADLLCCLCYDFYSIVESAMLADPVRKLHLMALWALYDSRCGHLESLCSTSISSAF